MNRAQELIHNTIFTKANGYANYEVLAETECYSNNDDRWLFLVRAVPEGKTYSILRLIYVKEAEYEDEDAENDLSWVTLESFSLEKFGDLSYQVAKMIVDTFHAVNTCIE